MVPAWLYIIAWIYLEICFASTVLILADEVGRPQLGEE